MAYIHRREDVCRHLVTARYNSDMLSREAASGLIVSQENQFRPLTDAEFLALRDLWLCDGGRSVEQILEIHNPEEICARNFGDAFGYNTLQNEKGPMVYAFPEWHLSYDEIRRAQRALCPPGHEVDTHPLGRPQGTVVVPVGPDAAKVMPSETPEIAGAQIGMTGVLLQPGQPSIAAQPGGLTIVPAMREAKGVWIPGQPAPELLERPVPGTFQQRLEEETSKARTFRVLAIGGGILAVSALVAGGVLLLRKKKPRRGGRRR